MSSIKKNLALQTVYQLLAACMPIITAPLLSRRLGATQLGIFSYTSSVVLYFTLFAMLGTVNYGTRSIAAVKENRQLRNETFSSIILFQIFTTICAIFAYGIYIVFFCDDNQLIATLQGISLLSCLVDINWLFFGVEDFQITVSRSIVIKITTVVAILFLVKNESDLWIYTLIMLAGTFVSNFVLLFYLPRYASPTKVTFNMVKQHIKPNLVLFVPLLAMTVYHAMDKTMLGILSSYDECGFYYNSDKIVQIPLLIINGIGTVMLPRMTSLLSEGKKNEANNLFLTTVESVIAISIAMACGIAAVSKEFIPLFFGDGYEPCILLTIVFAPMLLFKGLSVIVRTQYLIPMKMEKEFTKSVIGGAIVNFVLNISLIPLYGAMGATIATVIAELAACALQFLSLRDAEFRVKDLIPKVAMYFVFGLLMIFCVRAASLVKLSVFPKLVLEVLTGVIIYSLACIVYWKRIKNVFFLSLLHSFKELDS